MVKVGENSNQRQTRPFSTIPLDEHGQEDLRLLAQGEIPIILPPKGTQAPIHGIDELAMALKWIYMPEQVRMVTVVWLSSHQGFSSDNRNRYINEIGWWLWWLRARYAEFDRVSALEADLFDAAMRAAGLSASTRRGRITVVSSWYNHLIGAGCTVSNPFDGMTRPKPPASSVPHITDDQLVGILAHAAMHESIGVQAILVTLVATGFPVSSLTEIRVQRLTRNDGHWILRLSITDGSHAIILPSYAGQVLHAYRATRRNKPGLLFTTRSGAPLQPPYINQLVRRIARAAGIDNAERVSAQAIQHSISTSHSQKTIRTRPGHSSAVTAQPGLPSPPPYRCPTYRLYQQVAAEVARRQRRQHSISPPPVSRRSPKPYRS
ncbi:tyrosine-type recombinase/integrase [Streptosporangium sp. NPDC049248]|uniref:tyrosine-type recombinase/integrase n=1 Tax=Streptosporangium sp. NPDC049248 TaxID=3155651 RepID=UPI00341686EE